MGPKYRSTFELSVVEAVEMSVHDEQLVKTKLYHALQLATGSRGRDVPEFEPG